MISNLVSFLHSFLFFFFLFFVVDQQQLLYNYFPWILFEYLFLCEYCTILIVLLLCVSVVLQGLCQCLCIEISPLQLGELCQWVIFIICPLVIKKRCQYLGILFWGFAGNE